MTKITHYVSSISHRGEFVWVLFQEIPTRDSLNNYLNNAAKSWKECHMPGIIPKDIIIQLRNHRFKNEFEMRFPFIDWAKRDLKIMDKVEIDMPLQMNDIISVGTNEGI